MPSYVIPIVFGGLALFFVTIFVAMNRSLNKAAKRRELRDAVSGFVRALHSNLKSGNYDEQAGLLSIIHRKLALIDPEISPNLTDLIESYIYHYETSSPQVFKQLFDLDKDPLIRDRALALLAFLRKREPFATISARPAAILRTLQQALDSGNHDLASTTMTQLVDQIGQMEETERLTQKRARTTYVLSLIGLVLTATFGLISLIQLVYPLVPRR